MVGCVFCTQLGGLKFPDRGLWVLDAEAEAEAILLPWATTWEIDGGVGWGRTLGRHGDDGR